MDNEFDYTWEFGIDWDALPNAGLRYLPQGLVNNNTGAVSPLHVPKGKTINVKIFDVSPIPPSTESGNRIKSFSIIIRPADFGLLGQPQGDPFDLLQLTFSPSTGTEYSPVFSKDPAQQFPVWLPFTPPSVINPKTHLTATTAGRFLVSFLVQAAGPDPGTNYIFAHDPEMIVGPDM